MVQKFLFFPRNNLYLTKYQVRIQFIVLGVAYRKTEKKVNLSRRKLLVLFYHWMKLKLNGIPAIVFRKRLKLDEEPKCYDWPVWLKTEKHMKTHWKSWKKLQTFWKMLCIIMKYVNTNKKFTHSDQMFFKC